MLWEERNGVQGVDQRFTGSGQGDQGDTRQLNARHHGGGVNTYRGYNRQWGGGRVRDDRSPLPQPPSHQYIGASPQTLMGTRVPRGTPP